MSPLESDSASITDETSLGQAAADQTSREFEVRWSQLISVTNWEKGRIIHNWRQALAAAGAAGREYSDEAWSRRVGGVSGQHAGRLRRVHERFADIRKTFAGLFWSHFQSALDWNDAEMWLEGAVQNSWSVQQMREQRFEALGGPAEERPQESQLVEAEFDEDASGGETARPAHGEEFGEPRLADGTLGPNTDEGPDFGSEAEAKPDADRATPSPTTEITGQETAVAPLRPFEDMPDLPADMAEAVELVKLSIIRHKANGWRDVALDDVLYVLNGLKQLATAPAE